MGHHGLTGLLPAMAVAVLLAAGPLPAAEDNGDADPSADDGAAPLQGRTASDPAVEEAIDIIGRRVIDREHERIGRVSNVLIGPSGRVDAVVIKTGGVLGLGGREYEIPWNRIAMSPDGRGVMVGVAGDDLETEFSAFEVEPMDSGESDMIREPADATGTTDQESAP